MAPDAAARAAVVLASCAARIPAERWLESFASPVEPQADLAQCLSSRRNGCLALHDCMATTYEHESATTTRCEGSVAITWLGADTMRVDCAALGQECIVAGALAECIPRGGGSCVDGAARCAPDGRPIVCRAGREVIGGSCTALGFNCRTDGARAYCAGRGPACATAACDGRRIAACVGGSVAVLECAHVLDGSTCTESGTGAYCGLGVACPPDASSTQCAGDEVGVCNRGRLDRVSCRDLGFRGCIERRSMSGSTYAACVP